MLEVTLHRLQLATVPPLVALQQRGVGHPTACGEGDVCAVGVGFLVKRILIPIPILGLPGQVEAFFLPC